MIKRNIILTTAAVCLAASLMLIIGFTMRNPSIPAWVGNPFSRSECASPVNENTAYAVADTAKTPVTFYLSTNSQHDSDGTTYDYMKSRSKEYRERLFRLKKDTRRKTDKNTRPQKPLSNV